jgi:hypothetical protein
MAVDPKKYSLYAQRDLEKQYVNWGKVAQDITTGITTIAGERQARKDELDKLTNEAIENLSAVPDVESQDAGTMIINASDMSKKNLQIQSDLLKRGLITPKDFKLFMEKQKTGYSSYSTAIKQWDGWYQKSLERIDKEEASAGEMYNNTSLEAFGNLQNKVLMTNPANGQLQLVEMGKAPDGTYTKMPDLKKNPSKVVSPHAINLRMNMKSNKKVLTDEAKKLVDPMGRIIKSYTGEDGKMFSKEGFRYRDSQDVERTYKDWLNSSADALTATNDDQMQILAGQGYHIAQSVDEFKEKHGDDTSKMILVSYASGTPVYSLVDANGKEIKGGLEKEAKKQARFALDDQIDDMTKADNEDKRPPSEVDKEDTLIGFMDDVNALISDDKETFDATAQDRIIAMNDKVRSSGKGRLIDNIDRNDDRIIVTYQDGSVEYVKRKGDDGSPLDAKTQSRKLWRLITNENDTSYRKAIKLYEDEGGFRSSDREATTAENRVFLTTRKAEDVLANKGIEPGDDGYEDALKIEIVNQDKSLNPKELAAIKRRVLKGKNITSYSSLPSIGMEDGKLKNNSKSVIGFGDDGKTMKTGTELLEQDIGATVSWKNDDTITKGMDKVLKLYLPKSLRAGARATFVDNPDGDDLIIEYYDAKGQLQTIGKEVNTGNFFNQGALKASELNDILYDASIDILNQENDRRRTRNRRGVSKEVIKFNG